MRRLTYDDEARLEYGRMLWRNAAARARLLRHWEDARHPSAERFVEKWRPWVEKVLASESGDEQMDAELRREGTSLRAVVKEIPPVFGRFY